jgi:methionyl-tRNA formyltransferase
MIVEALAGLAAGRVTPRPQPAAGVTYAKKIEKDEGRLDWSRPATELERIVRALNPWPGAWFEHDGARIKVHAAEAARGAGAPGTVLDDRLTVACGEGALRLTRLQRPGRAAVDADAFLRGFPLPRGSVL